MVLTTTRKTKNKIDLRFLKRGIPLNGIFEILINFSIISLFSLCF